MPEQVACTTGAVPVSSGEFDGTTWVAETALVAGASDVPAITVIDTEQQLQGGQEEPHQDQRSSSSTVEVDTSTSSTLLLGGNNMIPSPIVLVPPRGREEGIDPTSQPQNEGQGAGALCLPAVPADPARSTEEATDHDPAQGGTPADVSGTSSLAIRGGRSPPGASAEDLTPLSTVCLPPHSTDVRGRACDFQATPSPPRSAAALTPEEPPSTSPVRPTSLHLMEPSFRQSCEQSPGPNQEEKRRTTSTEYFKIASLTSSSNEAAGGAGKNDAALAVAIEEIDRDDKDQKRDSSKAAKEKQVVVKDVEDDQQYEQNYKKNKQVGQGVEYYNIASVNSVANTTSSCSLNSMEQTFDVTNQLAAKAEKILTTEDIKKSKSSINSNSAGAGEATTTQKKQKKKKGKKNRTPIFTPSASSSPSPVEASSNTRDHHHDSFIADGSGTPTTDGVVKIGSKRSSRGGGLSTKKTAHLVYVKKGTLVPGPVLSGSLSSSSTSAASSVRYYSKTEINTSSSTSIPTRKSPSIDLKASRGTPAALASPSPRVRPIAAPTPPAYQDSLDPLFVSPVVHVVDEEYEDSRAAALLQVDSLLGSSLGSLYDMPESLAGGARSRVDEDQDALVGVMTSLSTSLGGLDQHADKNKHSLAGMDEIDEDHCSLRGLGDSLSASLGGSTCTEQEGRSVRESRLDRNPTAELLEAHFQQSSEMPPAPQKSVVLRLSGARLVTPGVASNNGSPEANGGSSSSSAGVASRSGSSLSSKKTVVAGGVGGGPGAGVRKTSLPKSPYSAKAKKAAALLRRAAAISSGEPSISTWAAESTSTTTSREDQQGGRSTSNVSLNIFSSTTQTPSTTMSQTLNTPRNNPGSVGAATAVRPSETPTTTGLVGGNVPVVDTETNAAPFHKQRKYDDARRRLSGTLLKITPGHDTAVSKQSKNSLKTTATVSTVSSLLARKPALAAAMKITKANSTTTTATTRAKALLEHEKHDTHMRSHQQRNTSDSVLVGEQEADVVLQQPGLSHSDSVELRLSNLTPSTSLQESPRSSAAAPSPPRSCGKNRDGTEKARLLRGVQSPRNSYRATSPSARRSSAQGSCFGDESDTTSSSKGVPHKKQSSSSKLLVNNSEEDFVNVSTAVAARRSFSWTKWSVGVLGSYLVVLFCVGPRPTAENQTVVYRSMLRNHLTACVSVPVAPVQNATVSATGFYQTSTSGTADLFQKFLGSSLRKSLPFLRIGSGLFNGTSALTSTQRALKEGRDQKVSAQPRSGSPCLGLESPATQSRMLLDSTVTLFMTSKQHIRHAGHTVPHQSEKIIEDDFLYLEGIEDDLATTSGEDSSFSSSSMSRKNLLHTSCSSSAASCSKMKSKINSTTPTTSSTNATTDGRNDAPLVLSSSRSSTAGSLVNRSDLQVQHSRTNETATLKGTARDIIEKKHQSAWSNVVDVDMRNASNLESQASSPATSKRAMSSTSTAATYYQGQGRRGISKVLSRPASTSTTKEEVEVLLDDSASSGHAVAEETLQDEPVALEKQVPNKEMLPQWVWMSASSVVSVAATITAQTLSRARGA
ncbi:unnamed protein product [Amoebophrya sp. A25]|nr:unnamed protein product [Amoebophrya sp. A25]|eukprot:GSA25T00000157001.1